MHEPARFAYGDRVAVYNSTMDGKPMFEGMARIVGPTEVENQYRVRFEVNAAGNGANLDPTHEGQVETIPYTRFVYGGPPQDDPLAYIEAALIEYEADLENETFSDANT